ncbi:hypothetical protein [Brevibacillus sp. NRS-1366]|uniref:hypothetical protein n=1 Tax=Brevibacillus sp. NRS-1366 TaxID=3233899 RepID=UPI003D1C4951
MQEAKPTFGVMLKSYDGLKTYEKVLVVVDIPEEERINGTKILVEDLTGEPYWVEESDVRIDFIEGD